MSFPKLYELKLVNKYMKILVTGGAGYIGSHVVKVLAEAGHELTIVDNLSNGFRQAVVAGELFVCDLADQVAMDRLFATKKFEAVFHFAAYVNVFESMSNPDKYFANNTQNSERLVQLCLKYGCNKFVFSSTAAVYGEAPFEATSEDAPKNPINPYGMSKLKTEQILQAVPEDSPFRFVTLRYFNVAGADLDGKIGQSTNNATHLIKVIAEVASGKRSRFEIYGTDYPTPDGTCIRDYIHVMDLATAHVHALDYLNAGNKSDVFNCGYGFGFSVNQVLEKAQQIAGRTFEVVRGPRRAGDPASVVSNVEKIKKTFNWKPQYADLGTIIKTSYEWEKSRHY